MVLEKSYIEYYFLVVEISRLKHMININYRLRFLSEYAINVFHKRLKEHKNTLKDKYTGYKYCEKINGVTLYVN